jgi:anti-sigma factor RsiW
MPGKQKGPVTKWGLARQRQKGEATPDASGRGNLGELLTCDAIAARGVIERYLAGRLSEAEVETFEAHYLTCSHCQRELRLAIAIRDGLPEVGPGRGGVSRGGG